jgi:hypothetical protein
MNTIMAIENQKFSTTKAAVNSWLMNLLTHLASIKSIVHTADRNSAFASKIDLIIELLTPVIHEGLKANLSVINIDLMEENIKSMNQIIEKEKAENSLISDELVIVASATNGIIINIQSLIRQGEIKNTR